ncbi:hypothetical protein JOB18_041139 [Solea senegalensis]|uniref:Uncharacterized protein n=1 Tax=Solea senegalensis TaxID=28829 RepID=A0AAV6T1A6_SOLSE|nr:hypothetical protein JOB18_041139 [Solea senegalensis]
MSPTPLWAYNLFGKLWLPEVIERALFERLENFPKFSNKDPQKLRELGDLLTELNSAKSEGYLPGLSYLDTAVQSSREMAGQGFTVQRTTLRLFSPLCLFHRFHLWRSTQKKRPQLLSHSNPLKMSIQYPKYEQPERGMRNVKRQISTHKTDVDANCWTSQSDCSSYKPDDIGKQCCIHQKPHPLKKCWGFRSKSLEERKAFLKENGICFKCCSSTTHLAKNCKAALKCSECDVAALLCGAQRTRTPPHSMARRVKGLGQQSPLGVQKSVAEGKASGPVPRSVW